MTRTIHTPRRCCQSRPRCAGCPVVLQRLSEMGLAERTGKRAYKLSDVNAKTLAKVQAR